jgi:gliding motility-associated lipoprotein GldB
MSELKTFQIYFFFLCLLGVAGCGDSKRVDVSKIDLDVRIERFDQELSAISPSAVASQNTALQRKYGNFYTDFMEKMLGAGNPAEPAFAATLQQVLTDKDFIALREEVAAKFPDMKQQEQELTDAFRHVKYYFPKQRIPRLVTFFSGFTVQTPIGNDYIGIGLDMFLGDSKFYPALVQSIPLYLSRRFNKANITPRVMETFIREEMFPEPGNLETFLDRMVYNGKILYLMQSVMPDVPDSVLVGYTTSQQQWAEEFEAEIWGLFLEQNLLFETDYMKIQMYLSEAPFTPGLGEKNESAPKLGVFTGWKIVQQYMEREKGVTLQQLMSETDYQKILNLSKYKPK